MNRAKEIYELAQDIGKEAAAAKLGIKPESVRRAKRKFKQTQNGTGKTDDFKPSDKQILEALKSKFSDKEIQAILNGSTFSRSEATLLDLKGTKIKFGIISDTHIGSKDFEESWLLTAFQDFKEQGVDIIFHVGDVTEGMSNRPDQIYSLSHIGYDEQKQYAIELFSKTDIPIYAVDGNHDRWYIKSNGAKIVKDIAAAAPNFNFVGHDYAEIRIGGLDIMLWHGEDGSSYATSYRIQKIIESLRGGEKPHLLFAGHVHKHGYFFDRNIHSFLCPAMQRQTAFMRGKRLPAHTGYWTVEIVFSNNEVKRCSPTYTPFYK